MSAQQELQGWLQHHNSLSTNELRAAFRKEVVASLSARSEAELVEGLLALKKSVQTTRAKAAKQVAAGAKFRFQVSPVSAQDHDLLRAFLHRLNIPFEVVEVRPETAVLG